MVFLQGHAEVIKSLKENVEELCTTPSRLVFAFPPLSLKFLAEFDALCNHAFSVAGPHDVFSCVHDLEIG